MKQNRIALATNIGLMAIQLAGAEREAALKMPLKDATRELAVEIQKQLDENLREAIDRRMGTRGMTQEDLAPMLAGRFTVHPDGFDPETDPDGSQRGDTYAIDGVPILWAGPVKLERYGDEGDEHVKATRPLRFLV